LVGNQTLFETGKIRIANLAVGVASVPKSLSLRYANTETPTLKKIPVDNKYLNYSFPEFQKSSSPK
jgi:hypothetical protein